MGTTAVSRGRKRASGDHAKRRPVASGLRPAAEASVLRPEDLFERHYLLACYIAHNTQVTMDIDDRIQECTMALWECCVNYTPNGGKFWTWAYKRVHGALIDAFRKLTHRGLRCEISTDEIPELHYTVEPLYDITDSLNHIKNNYKPQTWRILELRASGLTTAEVGRVMGIAESRVSQILGKVLNAYAFGKTETRLRCVRKASCTRAYKRSRRRRGDCSTGTDS